MTKLDVTKSVAKFIVGTSTVYTVKTVLSSNVKVEKPHQQAEIYIGSYAIGAVVAKQSENWIDEKIDATVAWFKKNVKKS